MSHLSAASFTRHPSAKECARVALADGQRYTVASESPYPYACGVQETMYDFLHRDYRKALDALARCEAERDEAYAALEREGVLL